MDEAPRQTLALRVDEERAKLGMDPYLPVTIRILTSGCRGQMLLLLLFQQ